MRNIILLTILLFLTSCATSRRMGRFFDEKALSPKKEPDRTNVFPLFYVSGTSTSFLWPLMDKDEHGFAVRPIFNKEGNEYALLFPFSAWNPVKGDGWVGPYFWNKDYQMLFPLFYKDEDSFQFLTYYNFAKGSGLFPIYHVSDDSLWMWGIYDWKDKGYATRHRVLWSLLSHWETQKSGDYFRYVFPFVSWKDGQETGAFLFPLFSQSSDGKSARSFLLPMYYYSKDRQGNGGLHTLLGGQTKKGNSTTTNITPLWWSGRSPQGDYDFLFPAFYRSSDSKGSSLWFLPWYSNVEKSVSTHMLFPLFFNSSSEKYSSSVTPLSWFSKSPYHSRQHIFPIYNSVEKYDKDGNVIEKSWYSPALLPLVSRTESQSKSSTKALYGLLYNSERDGNETNGSVLGILSDWSSGEKKSHFRFPAIFDLNGLIGYSEENKTSKLNILLYSHEKNEKVTRRDIFPFITWDSGENESGFSFLWRVFETHNRNGKNGGHFMFIPWGT